MTCRWGSSTFTTCSAPASLNDGAGTGHRGRTLRWRRVCRCLGRDCGLPRAGAALCLEHFVYRPSACRRGHRRCADPRQLCLRAEARTRPIPHLHLHLFRDGKHRHRHGLSLRPLSFRSGARTASHRRSTAGGLPPLVRHGLFFLDRRRNSARRRGFPPEAALQRHSAAGRGRVRDDAMGLGPGTAQRDGLQGLDLARWRRVLRRACLEFLRLASDLLAILPGLRALSAPAGRGARARRQP